MAKGDDIQERLIDFAVMVKLTIRNYSETDLYQAILHSPLSPSTSRWLVRIKRN